MSEQPAQVHPAPDRPFLRGCRPVTCQWDVVLALMRTIFVVMSEVLEDDMVQLALTCQDEMVERFVLDGLRLPLRKCVQIGSLDGLPRVIQTGASPNLIVIRGDTLCRHL